MEKHVPFWSKQLRRERERRGWSQSQVAEKIGVDTKTIVRWENGEIKTLPRLDCRALLCELYGKTAEELGFFKEDTDTNQIEREVKNPEATSTALKHSDTYHADWGEAPHVRHLYGRGKECSLVEQWIVDDKSQIVAVLGAGGIGKTALTATVAEKIQQRFDYVFWRSLQNAPPPLNVLQKCILFLSDNQQIDLPHDVEDQISLLIDYLRRHHCLLILDNLETILQSGNEAGLWHEGYEGYGRLIKRLGETQHRSCLLLTSREKPKEVAHAEGKTSPVRSLPLPGLELAEAKEILQDVGLFGSEDAWKALIYLYSGNPLALKIVAGTIREVFGGDIVRFLKEGKAVFGDVGDLLDKQFLRLSALEQEILYWLAVEREPVSLDDLRENIVRLASREALLRALDSLRRRYMIETSNIASFTVQPVVMEYVTNKLVEQICKEIEAEKPKLLASHALMKAQAKDYVRESQVRLIVTPVIQRLFDTLEREDIEQKFKRMLAVLRQTFPRKTNYAAGNVLNLLIQLGCALRGYDFSHLVVWQAYLQGVVLPEVNFAHADLAKSVFTDTFGSILSVAFSPHGDLLVAGTTTGEILVWHAPSGIPLQAIQGHTDEVKSVVFSPDGKVLASGSDDQTVRLWDVSNGQCLNTLLGHAHQVWSVAFSPDGKTLVSSGYDQTVRLWDVSSGQSFNTLPGYTSWILSVAFSPDGKTLASSGYDQTVRLWDVSSGRCLNILLGHTSWVRSVAFSPDGKTLASGGYDQTVRLWDVSSGQCFNTFLGHTEAICTVTFSPDGKTLASGSDDQTVRLWDVSSGQCLNALLGHTHRVYTVAFSSDGKTLASDSCDQTVRLWNVSSGQCLNTLLGHPHRARSVAFSPDRKTLASGSYNGAINLWDLQTGAYLQTFRSERPYERMNITQVKGLTEARKATLRLLGATEDEKQELA